MKRSSSQPRAARHGFSLIEVVIATAILGASLAALLTYASTCLKVLSYSSRYQEAQRVRSLAELEHPLVVSNDLDEINVPETEYEGGMTFSRQVDQDDEDEDDLYVVTTTVRWQERGLQRQDDVVEYIYFEKEEDE